MLLLLFRAAEATEWKAGLFWLLCGGLMALAAQERSNLLIFMVVFPLLAGWPVARRAKGRRRCPCGG